MTTASDTEQPKTPKSRHQKTGPCGVCGRDTAINRDGTFRVHGAPENRCNGTGIKIHAAVRLIREDGAVTVYGTCGVCGLHFGTARKVGNTKLFLREHNHGRPRVTAQHGRFSVIWFRYRTFEWRNRYFDTNEEAMDFASNIKEHTR